MSFAPKACFLVKLLSPLMQRSLPGLLRTKPPRVTACHHTAALGPSLSGPRRRRRPAPTHLRARPSPHSIPLDLQVKVGWSPSSTPPAEAQGSSGTPPPPPALRSPLVPSSRHRRALPPAASFLAFSQLPDATYRLPRSIPPSISPRPPCEGLGFRPQHHHRRPTTRSSSSVSLACRRTRTP